ncbi:DUF1707 domain-containing protein [Kutzneria sp. NPDC052558]|uniref:DUF1707 domain-containing protein n=1 Tax=Kutzneria sp. NPDC052558 TaxID=3364121 RepID=UPI0037C7EEC4
MDQGDRPVTDAERERALRLLEMAVGHGMLSVAEFTDNSTRVLSVATVNDLEVLLAEVPGISAKAFDDRPLTLQLTGRTLVRRGDWAVPGEIALSGENGRVLLDFSRARFRSMTVAVDVNLKSTRLKIIVPNDVAVDLAQLNKMYCHMVNRAHPETEHFISIALRGSAVFGTVLAKRARR